MATITRGKTFTTNEEVTNSKLHTLVDSATISNIVSTDIDGTAAQLVIRQGSAPSSPSSGWLWFDTTNALLRVYDGSTWQPVARGYSYTNQSGGSLAAGDVVVLDTSNASSVTTTTSASDTDVFGVVLIGGAAAASVVVLTEGYCPSVTLDSSASIGDFIFTDTVAKQGTPSATFGSGALGRALGTGTSPAMNIGGLSSQVSGARFADAGTSSGSRGTASGTGTQTVAHGLSVTPNKIEVYGRIAGLGDYISVGSCFVVDSTFSNGSVYNDVNATEQVVRSDACIGYGQTDGTNRYVGAVTAVDGTNVTITWTLTGSVTSRTIDFVLNCSG